MKKHVKIVYESVMSNDPLNSGNLYYSVLVQALIPFGGKNTSWIDNIDYSENFDKFVQDTIDCGFLYINPTTAITIFQIKAFEHYIETIVEPDVEKPVNTAVNVVKKPYPRRKRKNTNKNVVKTIENGQA